MKRKYNRAFIKDVTHPAVSEILENTGSEELEYWIMDSKESFHGEEDGKYFYFKDSRTDRGMKLPLECLDLEFYEEEIKDISEGV
jgi:hypothetical protein